MSQVFSRSVNLRGDACALFDSMSSFLSARGFTVISAERPFTMVADRGSLRPTNRIEKYPHTLAVALHPANEGLAMSFIYLMSDFWHYTSCDQKFFNNEIDLFVRGLVTDGAILEQTRTSPARDAAYIGELRELAKLKEEGVVTIEEFDLMKRKLLGI